LGATVATLPRGAVVLSSGRAGFISPPRAGRLHPGPEPPHRAPPHHAASDLARPALRRSLRLPHLVRRTPHPALSLRRRGADAHRARLEQSRPRGRSHHRSRQFVPHRRHRGGSGRERAAARPGRRHPNLIGGTMALHFSKNELAARRRRACRALGERGLDGLVILRQESMYYLTGYDTSGYSMFQGMYLGADGKLALCTRSPDLRQARLTSVIKDIRIWRDRQGATPGEDLRDMLESYR